MNEINNQPNVAPVQAPPQVGKQLKPFPFIGIGLVVLAFCFCKVTALSIILAIAGFVLSIIGCKRRYKLNGLAIAGIPLAVIALIVAIAVSPTDPSSTPTPTPTTPNTTTSPSSGDTDVDIPSSSDDETTPATSVDDGKSDEDTYKESCETVSYDDVARTPDSFKGKNVAVEGTVIQVSETSFLGISSTTLRVAEGGDYNKIWYVTYSPAAGESRILENDYVTLYGSCNGVESYTSIWGSQVTIPSVKAKYIVLGKVVDGENISFDAEQIASSLEVQEYVYDSGWFNYYFLVVKNTSAYTIDLVAAIKYYDANGQLIGAGTASEDTIAPGYTAILYDMPDSAFASASYELTSGMTTWYTSMQDSLSYEVVEGAEKLIVTMKNNGTEAAQFPKAQVIFFKDGEPCGYDSSYFTDSDMELKARKESTQEITCYSEYNSYIISISARK